MDDSAKLTILVTSRQRRGAEVFGERLAVNLPEFGWHVDFVALAEAPAEAAATVSAEALSPNPPSALGRLDFGVVRALRERLRRHGTEVLLANGSSTLQYSVAATRLMRRRPGVAYGSIGEPDYWARSVRQRALYALLLRMVDRVFSVSEATGRQLVESFGVDPAKLRVLHTGVPAELFEIRPEARDGDLRVLFLGSLSAEKDPLAALAAVAEAGREVPVRLRFVGGGPLAAEIEAEASRLGMIDRVEIAGSVDDVKPHLAWADVLLMTSRTEGLPAAPLEAAAAAVPAVAYAVGGTGETLRDGVTGTLVTPGDISGAAGALVDLADEDRRRGAAEEARAFAMSEFTVSDAVARYDAALRELLEERHR